MYPHICVCMGHVVWGFCYVVSGVWSLVFVILLLFLPVCFMCRVLLCLIFTPFGFCEFKFIFRLHMFFFIGILVGIFECMLIGILYFFVIIFVSLCFLLYFYLYIDLCICYLFGL